MATPSVVVIEQDPEYLEPLDRLLRERGVSVWTAREGKDVLQIIVDHPPDLILLAVKLPNVSGYKICKKLKTHTRFQDTPLFLLANPEERDTLDLHRKLKTRAEEYFIKPFPLHELRDKVLEYLFGASTEEAPFFPKPSSLEGALVEDEALAPRSVMPLPPQHSEASDEEPEVEAEPPTPEARPWGGDGFRSFEGARHLAVTSPRVIAPPPALAPTPPAAQRVPAPPAPAPHPFEDLPLDDMLEALDAQRSAPSEDEPDLDPAPLSTPPPFPAPLPNLTMMGTPAFIEPTQDLTASGAYPQLSRSRPHEDPEAPPKRGASDSASDGEGLAARLQRRDQQLKELREKQELLYSENLTLQETLAQAHRELLDAEQHRARRGLELERLRDQLARVNEEQQEQESDRASLQGACAQLQRDLEQARAGQQRLTDELAAAQDTLAATQDKLAAAQDTLASTQDESTATQNELAAAREERARLQQELHLARQRNIDARQAQEEAQDQAEELAEELRQARQAAQSLAQERERLQHELGEAQRAVTEGEQQRVTESDQLTRLKGALQHARDHLRAVISKAENDMKELREEYVKARQQWKQEQAIMAEEQRRLSDLVKDLEGRADDLYRQLDDKTQEYDLLREEHQDLWKTLQASEEDVGRLTRDLEQVRQELQHARLQHQELELAKQQEERAHKLSQEAQRREEHLHKVCGLHQEHISTLERALEETERSHQATRNNLQKATAYAASLEERLRNVGEAFGKLGQLLAASSENLVASKDFLSIPSLPSYSSIPALPARPARPVLPEAPAPSEVAAPEGAPSGEAPPSLGGASEEPAKAEEGAEAAPPAPTAQGAPEPSHEPIVTNGDQTKLGAESIPPEAIGPSAEEKAMAPLSISMEEGQDGETFADLAQDLVDDLESSADFEMEMRRISAPPKAEPSAEELDAIPLAVSPLEQGSSLSIANMQQHDDPTFFSEKGPTTLPAGLGEDDDMLLDLEGDDELPLMEEGEQPALGEEMIELDDDAPLP
jgi:CheY-like chemotaxis protein